MTPEEKKEKIAFHIGKVLEILGLDLSHPSLVKTPERVAKMYVDEVFTGLNPSTYPEITFHDEAIKNDLILIKNISLISFCEHHLVPMMGIAHVGYLPNKGVIGLSKINSLLRYFAKRPQLQERLTEQIGEALQKELRTENLAIVIKMQHLCVVARGGEDQQSETETHVLKGRFQSDPILRSDFFLRISTDQL